MFGRRRQIDARRTRWREAPVRLWASAFWLGSILPCPAVVRSPWGTKPATAALDVHRSKRRRSAFSVGSAQRFGRDSVYAHELPRDNEGQEPPVPVTGHMRTEVQTEAEASAQRFGRDSVYASGTAPNPQTNEDQPQSSGSPAKVRKQTAHKVNPILSTPTVPEETAFADTLHNPRWIEDLVRIRSSVETANRTDHQFVAYSRYRCYRTVVWLYLLAFAGRSLAQQLDDELASMGEPSIPFPILAYRRRKDRKEERHEDKVERMF